MVLKMIKTLTKKQRTCEFCNKPLNKRFIKFTNVEQDVPVHYFCNKKCKFNWMNVEKVLLGWHPIDQEYIDEINDIVRKYKRAYKIIKKEIKKLKKKCKNE